MAGHTYILIVKILLKPKWKPMNQRAFKIKMLSQFASAFDACSISFHLFSSTEMLLLPPLSCSLRKWKKILKFESLLESEKKSEQRFFLNQTSSNQNGQTWPLIVGLRGLLGVDVQRSRRPSFAGRVDVGECKKCKKCCHSSRWNRRNNCWSVMG